MNIISKMLTEVIKSVLNRPISSKEYKKFGGSKCVFYARVRDNVGHLPDGCAIVLKNVIMHDVKENTFKKNMIFDYYKNYLTTDEIEYCNKNPNDFETFVVFALSKFIKPKSSLFSDIVIKAYPKTNSKEDNIISYSSKIEGLYKKLLDSFKNDFETGFSISRRMQELICDVILISEGLDESVYKNANKIEVVYSKCIPKENIRIQFKNVEAIIKAESKTIDKGERKDLIESSTISIRIILKWFYKEYIKRVYKLEFNNSEKFSKYILQTDEFSYEIDKYMCKVDENVEIIRGNHIKLMEKQIEIVENAEKVLAITGSRTRNEKYMKTIESAIIKNPNLEYYRILLGMPHNEGLKSHLFNCLKIVEPIEKEKMKRYLFLGFYKDTKLESEKFICSNEKQALVILPSFERIMKYDSGIVFHDKNDVSRMVEYVKQLYIRGIDITLENSINKLKVYKHNKRREN